LKSPQAAKIKYKKMEKLKRLVEACKFGFSFYVNNHLTCRLSIPKYLESVSADILDSDVYNKMLHTRSLIEIICYPNNSVGSFTVYHYDIELAIDEALKIIENG
jgi:hypothetical protein